MINVTMYMVKIYTETFDIKVKVEIHVNHSTIILKDI